MILISTELQLLPSRSPLSFQTLLILPIFLSVELETGKLERVSRFHFRNDATREFPPPSPSFNWTRNERINARYSIEQYREYISFHSLLSSLENARLTSSFDELVCCASGRGSNIERFHPPLFSELVCVCVSVYLYVCVRAFCRDTNLNENVDLSWRWRGGNSLTLLFLSFNASTRKVSPGKCGFAYPFPLERRKRKKKK